MTNSSLFAEGHHELDRLTTADETSSGSDATDQTQDGLKISSIESVTLSDGEARRTRTVPPIWRRFLLPGVVGFVTQIWGFCGLLMNLIE